MKIKVKKIIVVLTLILVLSFSFCKISIAAGGNLDPVSAMGDMNNGKQLTDEEGAKTIRPVINAIIGTIQVAGTGIALIMISILGIRYMMAAPNDKADVKKQIMPMVIGAILLFGAVNIIQIIANFTANTFN